MLSSKNALVFVVGLAAFTDTILFSLLPPLLPLYASALGLSQMQLGILTGGYGLTLLLATLPLGVLVDRLDRRWPFMVGLLLLAASTLLFAYTDRFVVLVVARLLQGGAACITWIVGMAMLADFFPERERGKAISLVFAFTNLGFMVGPAFAGWSVAHWGRRAPFLALVGVIMVDAVVRILLLPKQLPNKQCHGRYGALLKSPAVVRFCLGTALAAVLTSAVETLLPVPMSQRLGMSTATIGSLFFLSALCSTFVSPLVGHWGDRKSFLQSLLWGLYLAVFLLPLLGLANQPWHMYVLMVLFGVNGSLLMSSASPALASAVEQTGNASHIIGFSAWNFSFALGATLGPFVGSWLTEQWGLLPALCLLAVLFLSYALFAFKTTSRQRM